MTLAALATLVNPRESTFVVIMVHFIILNLSRKRQKFRKFGFVQEQLKPFKTNEVGKAARPGFKRKFRNS